VSENFVRAEQRAVQKMALGQQIAQRVKSAAQRTEHSTGEKVSVMLAECSTCENCWVGKGFETVTGDERSPDGADVEQWDAHGHFWSCGRRLCPSCSERVRRRARRVVHAAIDKHRQRVGYAWRFVTLTQPTLATSLTESLRILRRAWALLYKRDFWKQHVQGGAFGMEFEVNQIGYHTHLHLLVSSRFIPVELLIEEWETCVTKAHSESEAAAIDHCKKCGHTRQQHANQEPRTTNHGFRLNASVSVRLVRSKPGTNNAISMREAINEVIKYVTKPKTWIDLADAALLECATLLRWPRMFEIFGSLKLKPNTILDTEAITHGGMREPGDEEEPPAKKRAPGLRSLLSKMSLEQIKEEIVKRIKTASWFRMRQFERLYPYVHLFRMRDYLDTGKLHEAILTRAS
jgi:hypothetical protein